MSDFPKLRWPLDISVQKIDGQDTLIVKCPQGISPQTLYLTPTAAPIMACFTGEISKQEILAKFPSLSPDSLDGLISLLKRNLFMEDENLLSAKSERQQSFHIQLSRPPICAGGVYSNDEKGLKKTVDKFLKYGKPLRTNKQLITLVSPHIDYGRGGKTYGFAYNRLIKQKHDLYIVFGTCHEYTTQPFILCNCSYQTPLGMQPNDHEFINELAQAYGEQRSYADEVLHAKEHSIELQIPFITRLHPETPIVPILVGGIHYAMQDKSADNPIMRSYIDFTNILTSLLYKKITEGKKFCLIAGVDMSHIGRHFGDYQSLTPSFLECIKMYDSTYIQRFQDNDKRGLEQHIYSYDRTCRICGASVLYTILDILERLHLTPTTELLNYDQAVDYKTDCAVTFSALAGYI